MLNISIYPNSQQAGEAAGMLGAEIIRKAIAEKGEATIILATGSSQFDTLATLVLDKTIDWSKVRMFHLDEYIGLPVTHPASFRKYLTERFLEKVDPLKEVILINGENAVDEELSRLSALISRYTIDVAFVGIGENGHLAFNDPPADFDTQQPYLRVDLDEQCRKQQLGEGWFATLNDVPAQAISMSIQQILKSDAIICSVNDLRKAEAVKNCLEGPVNNMHPASILQTHGNCHFVFDTAAASLLEKQ